MPSSRDTILSKIRSALPQSSPLPDLTAVTNWQTFADPAEQFQFRIVLGLLGPKEGDIGLALLDLGLLDVEDGGLADLVAGLGQAKKLAVPGDLLASNPRLRDGL